MFDSMKFYDENGRAMFAVSSKKHSYEEAERMARRAFKVGKVDYNTEYNYAYHGFGKDRSGKIQNTYWITESVPKNGFPVYTFTRGSSK